MKKKLTCYSLFGVLFILPLILGACKDKVKTEIIDKEASERGISVELSDESYGLEFCNYHTGWWENNVFYAYITEGIEHKKRYTGEIGREAVEKLLRTLDLKEKNLQERLIGKEAAEEFEYNPNPELIGRTFLLYGIDTNEAIIIVTKTGEIYLQGIRYMGDKTNFREAFLEFIKEETADEVTQQKQLLQCYDDIVW